MTFSKGIHVVKLLICQGDYVDTCNCSCTDDVCCLGELLKKRMNFILLFMIRYSMQVYLIIEGFEVSVEGANVECVVKGTCLEVGMSIILPLFPL